MNINYRCYQITLRVKTFYANRERNEVFVDWIFITAAPAWRSLGEYVTLGKISYSLRFKQEVAAAAAAAAAPVISKFSSLSHFSMGLLLEI